MAPLVLSNYNLTLEHLFRKSPVVISLKSRLPIHKIRLEGPEIIDTSGAAYLISGKIGETAIQLGLNRLVTKSNYILTILTDKDSEVDITITSDEVEANKEIQKKGVGIFEYVSNVLIAVFLGFLTYVSFRMRRWKKVIKELDERLVSTSLCLDRRQESGKKLLNFYDFVIDKLQYMASTLKQAKDQYENKEFVFELLNKYDQINSELTKAFKDMAEDIKIEGICYNVKKDKTS